MSTGKLKEELLSYIANTDDEALLSLLKEDLIFYGKVKDADILDDLSEEQVKELSTLSDEDPMKNVDTFIEFKKAIGNGAQISCKEAKASAHFLKPILSLLVKSSSCCFFLSK